jgi:beta-glucanase (GH16 family)
MMISSMVGSVLLGVLHGASVSPWQLVFKDEFDGASLDERFWSLREWFPKHDHQEMFVRYGNVAVSDGLLRITTRAERACAPDGRCANYTSGWVESKGKRYWQHGRVVVRSRLPSFQTVAGLHASHWMMPENTSECWPRGGEIDIMEYVDHQDGGAVQGTYHHGLACKNDSWPGAGKAHGDYWGLGGSASPTNWHDDFHEYEVEWSEDSITWKVDGVPYYSFPDLAHGWTAPLPDGPMFLILDTAISAYFKAPPPELFPVVHEIDWVRVYQRSVE